MSGKCVPNVLFALVVLSTMRAQVKGQLHARFQQRPSRCHLYSAHPTLNGFVPC